MNAPTRVWDSLQRNRNDRLARARGALGGELAGKALPAARIADTFWLILEWVICTDSASSVIVIGPRWCSRSSSITQLGLSSSIRASA